MKSVGGRWLLVVLLLLAAVAAIQGQQRQQDAVFLSSLAEADSRVQNNSTNTCKIVTLAPFSLFAGDRRIAHPGSVTLKHMAAVALALEHLNQRDGTIIPELADLQCDHRQFQAQFVDTAFRESQTAEFLLPILMNKDDPPCGFIGAVASSITMIAATLTKLYEYPQLSVLSTSPKLSDAEQFRYFARLSPSIESTIAPDPLLTYLYQNLNVRHLIVAHSSTEYSNAIVNGLLGNAERFYPDFSLQIMSTSEQTEDFDYLVNAIHDSEIRYVYAIFDGTQYPSLFASAVRKGLHRENNYTWIWTSAGTEEVMLRKEFTNQSAILQIASGSLQYGNVGSAQRIGRYDAFVEAWKQLGRSEVDRDYLQSKVPQFPKDLFYRSVIDESLFETSSYAFSFAPLYYDTTILMGLAACATEQGSGAEHFANIMNTYFVGASGLIQLDPETRARTTNSSLFRIWNFVPVQLPNGSYKLEQMQIATYENAIWSNEGTPIFADGTSEIPLDLPIVVENKHYIGIKLRVTGVCMAALIVLLSLGFSLWTMIRQNERIVKASQPIFLHLVCLGTALMGASVALVSWDDETVERMDEVCATFPILLSLGWCISFSAIFSKTLRINMIFHNPRFKRIRVSAKDVMRPMLLLLSVNIVILVCWTVMDPLRWFREPVSYDSYGRVKASIGSCQSTNSVPYLAALLTVNAGFIAVASYQSYVARKISTEFSESDYIATSVTLVLIVSFMAGPMFILAEQSTDARFFMMASSVFSVSLSLLLLIFVPKVLYRGDGVQTAIRRSIVQNSSMHMDYTCTSMGEMDEVGTAVLDHPKLNSGLAERLRCAEREIRRLKECSQSIGEGQQETITLCESASQDIGKIS